MMYEIFQSFLCRRWVSVKQNNYLHPLLFDIINLIIFKHGQELSCLVNRVEKVLSKLLPFVGVVAAELVYTKEQTANVNYLATLNIK